MSKRTSNERLIGRIYEGVTDDFAWGDALKMIADAMHAAGAGLGVQDMKTHEFWAVAETGIDPALHETYARLAPGNRIWQAIGRLGRPLADQMVIPKPEFIRTPLYAEWFAPQGFHSVMAAPALISGSRCAVAVTFGNKRRGDFEEPHVGHLAAVAAHVGRAMSIRLEHERLAGELNARDLMLEDMEDGMLLLDATARVRHANAAARAVLARKDALVIRDGRLHCASPRHDADLRKAVSNASRGTAPASEIVIHRDERRPLLLRLIPSRGAQLAALFGGAVLAVRIKDPDREASPPPAQLAQLFGLTPSEAKAVLATARASSQGEAARHLGRAKTTLRTHLHHAYQKLGVHDPAEMVRLLAAYGFAQSPDQP